MLRDIHFRPFIFDTHKGPFLPGVAIPLIHDIIIVPQSKIYEINC